MSMGKTVLHAAGFCDKLLSGMEHKVIRKFFSGSLKKRILKVFVFAVLAFVFVTLAINIGMILAAGKHVYTDISAVPPRTAVLVLGSQIRGKRLSPVLEDRVRAGISLMETRKGKKLLLSGDHGQIYYDEVNAMRLYVLANAPAIQKEDIFMDHAGFNTYDSMYRAKEIFCISSLLVSTQDFHINRAVYIARRLGIEAYGYPCRDKAMYNMPALNAREKLARVKAFMETAIKRKPKYLGDVIPINGSGTDTDG